MRLDPDVLRICTLVLPRVKCEHLRLHMGLSSSPDVFQDRMNNLIGDLECARACLYDLLYLACESCEDYLDKLEQLSQRFCVAGSTLNTNECALCADQADCLCFCITRDGIKPADKKVHAILNLDSPKTLRGTRKILRMARHCRGGT